jgi:rare lipoprotein A (peptidoglycan hydrolase)
MFHPRTSSIPKSRSILYLTLVLALNLFLYGCSEQTPLPSVSPPIVSAPVATVPHPSAPAQVTTASWYGPGFHGHRTSCGEVYNQHALTAASRTLPIGSHAKVTNLATGKSVVVRINDHGPYVRGRGIDLSRAAAKRIGMDHKGVATVKVTRVDEHSRSRHHHPHVTDVDYAGGSYPATEASMAR